jgi:hypothetical protein
MPTYLTFDLTANSKAVVLKTNDTIVSPDVDYRCVVISIDDIARIVLEENDSDGINVSLLDGEKYPINPAIVTRVGIHDKSPATYGADSQQLLDDLIELIGW